MFSKIISAAVALLLATPIDDASAATKKKKKTTPLEHSQSATRGTSSMMRSDSYRGRVTQGRLPTPRGSTGATAQAAGGSTPAAAATSSLAGNTPPLGNQSFTLLPALPKPPLSKPAPLGGR